MWKQYDNEFLYCRNRYYRKNCVEEWGVAFVYRIASTKVEDFLLIGFWSGSIGRLLYGRREREKWSGTVPKVD